MERYQAILAYDGTSFWGFQAQPGFRTVEGELRSALGSLGWSGRTVLAGGRTDAGVHAEGQVAAFDLEWKHGVEELKRALNAILPKDVSCRRLQAAGPDFHPRYQALRRCYRYRIFSAAERDPLRERYALRVWPAPELARMQEAAGMRPGKRDFHAFGSAPRQGSHTVRTVFRAEWQRPGDALDFWIEADAFLFRMVRTIVATLLEVGGGRRSLEAFQGLLQTPVLGKSAPPAAACGLCLMRIDYPEGGK
jgi:tRNA pseudouridine38-40 synthase